MRRIILFWALTLALQIPLGASESPEKISIPEPTRYEQARNYVLNKIKAIRASLKQRGIGKKEAIALTVTLIGLYGLLKAIQSQRASGKPPIQIASLPDIQQVDLNTLNYLDPVQYKGEMYWVSRVNPLEVTQEKIIYEITPRRQLKTKYLITDQLNHQGNPVRQALPAVIK
jgi:hypothetical protein